MAHLVFGLFIGVMALVLAIVSWTKWIKDRQNVALSIDSAGWQTTPGCLTAVNVIERQYTASAPEGNGSVQSRYEPSVTYTYDVAGRHFTGSRINFKTLDFMFRKSAEKVVANYKAGQTIEVAYDSSNPQTSVLDRTTRPPAMSFQTVAFAALAVVLAICANVLIRLPD